MTFAHRLLMVTTVSMALLVPDIGLAASGQHVSGEFGGRHTANHGPRTPRTDTRGLPIAAGTIQHWTGRYTYEGVEYTYTMVGTDPNRGSATTVVPTVIIPLKFEFADGSTYDASTELIDGKTAAQGLIGSPIFQPTDFKISGIAVGKTQYPDAYQRANFWGEVSRRSPGYHVLLGQPQVLPVQTVHVSANGVFYFQDDVTGTYIPIVQEGASTIPAMLASLHVGPGTLPIFVTGIVQWYGKGFHGAINNASGASSQTYIVTAYYPSDIFGAEHIPDVWVLSHEVLEWVANPFGNNSTPGWNRPGYPLASCGSSTNADSQEVVDPFELAGVMNELVVGAHTFHFQDAVFLDFFTRASPSRSVNGAYSLFNGIAAPTSNCTGHLELAGTKAYWVHGGVITTGTGINDEGDIVGYYEDTSSFWHGFELSEGRVRTFDVPGASDTYPLKINNDGLIVGYFDDADGNLHGFSARNGAFQTLDFPGSLGTYAQGVNDNGEIVGGYYDTGYATHGFVLKRSRYSTRDSPLGPQSELTAIADSGTTAGFSSDWYGSVLGAFTHSKSGFNGVAVPDALQTWPYGLNDRGDLVGIDYEARVCPCTPGYVGFVSLASPPARQYRYLLGYAYGINNRGQIVGSYADHGFVGTLPR